MVKSKKYALIFTSVVESFAPGVCQRQGHVKGGNNKRRRERRITKFQVSFKQQHARV